MADGKDGEEFLFKRIESLGLRLEYDSGFLIVARSASADQSQDDDGEVEEAMLEELGKHLPDVAHVAVGKARGARGQNFVGSQVFVPSLKTFGMLKSVGEDGIARVAYSRENYKDPELPDVDVTHTGSGADLLLVLDDEGPVPASKPSFTWIADERLRQLFARACQAGIRVEHDSGLTLVKLRAVDGVEREAVKEIIRELGAKLGDVYPLMAARARGERGGNFVGRRVLVPAFFNVFGVIEGSAYDGSVTVRYRDRHTKSELTCRCSGADLLVVPDKRATPEPAPDQNSETTWQRLFRRVFGS
jgi:hypothetical protein